MFKKKKKFKSDLYDVTAVFIIVFIYKRTPPGTAGMCESFRCRDVFQEVNRKCCWRTDGTAAGARCLKGRSQSTRQSQQCPLVAPLPSSSSPSSDFVIVVSLCVLCACGRLKLVVTVCTRHREKKKKRRKKISVCLNQQSKMALKSFFVLFVTPVHSGAPRAFF